MRTHTTLIINPKGGSGKTTVATNLASYFAAQVPTALMDYDAQGSSLNWLKQRPMHMPRIHGANAAPAKPGRLRSMDMRVPEETRQLVIDAPAGASGLLLQEMLSRTNCILIPVAPSSIDIHATANFIRDLLLAGRIRAQNIRLGVVANRVRKAVPVYQPLERFLNSLNLPLLTRLSDSEAFVAAAETGVGVFEMEFVASAAERQQFTPIVEWLETPKLIVDPKAPSLLPFHPTISVPGRVGLRVVTKSIPAA
ncbi:MAG TPA: P-loop NTPase [Burkholderiales bacterium]|nr:P-loop NTPase [Burkholderiales bacterium]